MQWASILNCINTKHHILHTFLRLMHVKTLWRKGTRLIDVGSVMVGWLDAYLRAIAGAEVIAYAVGATKQCDDFLRLPVQDWVRCRSTGPAASRRVPEGAAVGQ